MNDIYQLIKKAREIMAPFQGQIDAIAKTYDPLLAQIRETLAKTAEAAQRWQEARKADVVVLADNGWYPNWLTFHYFPEPEPRSPDELMVWHLKEHWEDLTATAIELCPNREHILNNAFDLHNSGNYIASIPLFLSQADGICCESLKSFLFTGNETETKITELINNRTMDIDLLTDIFLEPFKLKNHHNVGISKANKAEKLKAPNRNGILHGHRKHLDYGTEINSLKCFSLLIFVIYATKDLIPDQLTNNQSN